MPLVNETTEVKGNATDSLWLIIGFTGGAALIIILAAVLFLAYHCGVVRRQRAEANRLMEEEGRARIRSRRDLYPTPRRGSAAHCVSHSPKGYLPSQPQRVENNRNALFPQNLEPVQTPQQPNLQWSNSQQQFNNYIAFNEVPGNQWGGSDPQGFDMPEQGLYDQWAESDSYGFSNFLQGGNTYQNYNNTGENTVPMSTVATAESPAPQSLRQDDDEPQPGLQRRNSRVSFVGVFKV
ncbi:hypothetical protein LSM04_006468 [Trypanosoma melophagium]|uniref:uncharacterized protein n=1 Tax=Trypanosoma melophagium TaxID=715481 RepID=UPI00351A3251|nr:hypothetical protein LSM04_006468 [Trypanosoma melophagium]